jgi:hypothetical protein
MNPKDLYDALKEFRWAIRARREDELTEPERELVQVLGSATERYMKVLEERADKELLQRSRKQKN